MRNLIVKKSMSSSNHHIAIFNLNLISMYYNLEELALFWPKRGIIRNPRKWGQFQFWLNFNTHIQIAVVRDQVEVRKSLKIIKKRIGQFWNSAFLRHQNILRFTSTKTSMAAPAACPELSASTRSSSFTIPPLATLTIRTPFLHLPSTKPQSSTY